MRSPEERRRFVAGFKIDCSGTAFIEATPEQREALLMLIRDSMWRKASIVKGGLSLPDDYLDISLDDSYYLGISATGEVSS